MDDLEAEGESRPEDKSSRHSVLQQSPLSSALAPGELTQRTLQSKISVVAASRLGSLLYGTELPSFAEIGSVASLKILSRTLPTRRLPGVRISLGSPGVLLLSLTTFRL